MLEVRDVRKRFGEIEAVRGVSFSVAKGERFGLLGPNGAGKSTTIAMITGTLDPDAGQISLNGAPVTLDAYGPKAKIGFVPQEIALFDDLSGTANLRFFASLYGIFGSEEVTRAARVLEIVGLTDRAKDTVKTYSGGMKRRLNIAAALMHDPELIILDEPTVGVDPQSRNAIFDSLLRLSAEGKTLIYTTHYMEEVEKLCTHVAIMDHGQLVAQEKLSDIQRRSSADAQVILDLAEEAPVALPGFESTQEGRSLTVRLNDVERDLPSLLAALAAAGAHYEAIRTHMPTLEHVFLDLTGRSLRD